MIYYKPISGEHFSFSRLLPIGFLGWVAVFIGAASSPLVHAGDNETVQRVDRHALSPIDFIELPKLNNPLLSPDGRYLLYTRSHVNWSENKRIRRYRLIDRASRQNISLFEPENEEESFREPTWSSSGGAFTAILKRKDDEYRQAYYYDIATETLERLTNQQADVSGVTWAPDKNGFYFLSSRPVDSKQKDLVENRWIIEAYESGEPSEIWFFDCDNGQAAPLVTGEFDVRTYTVTRDGGQILFSLSQSVDEDDHRRELWTYDLVTKSYARITDNNYGEYKAKVRPDGTSVAYISTVNEIGDTYYEDNLFLHRFGAATPYLLLPDVPMEILDFDWSADGGSIFIVGNTGLRTNLFEYDLTSGKLTSVIDGDHELKDWSYSERLDAHVYLLETPELPGEVHILAEKSEGQLTNEYGDLKSEYALPSQVAFQWKARDGQPLEGVLVYPLNRAPGVAFPLVTITHGGPRQSSQFGSWNQSRYVAVLAGQGYGVFLPNHRGGTGYGDAFMRDMVGNYFRNSHTDVLDGIDALIEAGLADPEKLVKMGWSAGGHMTNKLITATGRFKAASSGAGVADWISQYAESDKRHNRTPWFGGTPWGEGAPLASYLEQSILKDAWRATTPTLFFVGSRDVRVPPTQAIMMYRGVKAAGVETNLYVAPGEPHSFGKPSHQLFKINTELAWFHKHLYGTDFSATLPTEAFPDASKPPKADSLQAGD